MSVNIYDKDAGTLTALASGQRTWVGTKAAYEAAKQAGTLPNNAIIAITDDEKDHNHYSTDEVETGMYWIDGKPIYRKVVDFGALPNTSNNSITHGITNIGTVTDFRFIASDGNNVITAPFWWGNTTQPSVGVFMDSTKIYVVTQSDRSNYTSVYAIIEYTKTND